MLAIGKVTSGFGHYAGLVKLAGQTVALHADGVGTKVIVAQFVLVHNQSHLSITLQCAIQMNGSCRR
jgi:phosphoribosylaminoimidazole (AIR) synthetase